MPPPPGGAGLAMPAPAFASVGAAVRPAGVASYWRRLGAFMGPAYIVAVGYMDPGNWATAIAGGSRYGYTLLWVVGLSSLMAMVLQCLSAKLGIVSGLDLAQACRRRYPAPVSLALWLLAEIAIVACDLAEVIGTAIALQLLFHLPLAVGVLLSGSTIFIAMALEAHGFRTLEMAIVGVIVLVAACLGAELVFAGPDPGAIAAGLIPHHAMLADPAMLVIAAGIVGATVMPHNLYLHSAVIQTRRFDRGTAGKKEAIRFAGIDSIVALTLAMLVNAAILILAAAAFHGRRVVEDIGEAYHLLSPMLGVGAASLLFAVALLGSGQNSTLTGALAGQVVMEGFTDLRMPRWARRAITRGLAIVPACIVAILYGNDGTGRLLIGSQVLLSLQLPFAVIPLIHVTADRQAMGMFANKRATTIVAWAVALAVIATNVMLLVRLAG